MMHIHRRFSPFPSFHPSFALIRKLEESNSSIAWAARMLWGLNGELSKDENTAEPSTYTHTDTHADPLAHA